MTTPEQLRAHLLASGLASPDDLVGLDDAAIDRLEASAGLRFPAAYRSFLRVCGRGAGQFLRSTDAFGSALPHLPDAALAILAEEPFPKVLPPTALVFATHGGYQLWAIETAEGAPQDPPVYHFVMEQRDLMRVSDHFTDFIREAIEADRAVLALSAVAGA